MMSMISAISSLCVVAVAGLASEGSEVPADLEPVSGPAMPYAAPSNDDTQQQIDPAIKVRHTDADSVGFRGSFLPLSISPEIADHRALTATYAGYDTTEGNDARIRTVVEGALVNRVALQVRLDYRSASPKPTYGVGFRVAVLQQDQHHINLGLAGIYKNKGMVEHRGELEAVLAVSRTFKQRLAVFTNLTYGQGVIEKQRDAEVNLGGLYRFSKHLQVGFDTRARFDVGEGDRENEAEVGVEEGEGTKADVIAGPVASYNIGPAAILLQVAGHAVVREGGAGESTVGGLLAMAGLGLPF